MGPVPCCYSFPVHHIHSSAWRWVLLSALLQVLIFPLPGLYWLSWIAFTPLIVALLRARTSDTLQLDDAAVLIPATPWQGFLLAYACGVLWYAGTCYWIYDTMHHYGGLPAPVAAVMLAAFCLYLGLYHGLFGFLLTLVARRRSVNRVAFMSLPFLWVAVELARSRVTSFPWELLGSAQVDHISLSRIASFTGVYGISFEIMLVNTAFAAAFLVRREKRNLLLVASLAATVMLQGGRWLQPPPEPADRSALLVQTNIPILMGDTWTKDYFDGTLRDLTWISLHSSAASNQNPALIVWPESPAPFFTGDPLFRDAVGNVARTSGAWVIAGAIGTPAMGEAAATPTDTFNSAALFNPAGELAARYDKIHLVPFGEYVPARSYFPFMDMLTKAVGEFQRGHSRAPLNAGGIPLGLFICYESIFPDEIRQFARNGAQVLLNVSNDGWYGDSGAYAQHLQMTRMRAIENHRWLLSATNTGVTAAIDPDGRVVARVERKLRTTLSAPYALLSANTFYTTHGDWFAYACAIISLGALLFARFKPTLQ